MVHVNRNFLTTCRGQETGKDGLEPFEFLCISKILCQGKMSPELIHIDNMVECLILKCFTNRVHEVSYKDG